MTLPTIPWSPELLIALASGLWLAASAVAHWRRRRTLNQIADGLARLERQGVSARHELAGAAAAITSLGKHLDLLLQQLSIDERQARVTSSSSQGLDIAVRGARAGVSEDALVEHYGLSRQEAALLRQLNAPGSGDRRQHLQS